MSLEELKVIDAKTLSIGKLVSMIARGHTIYLNQHLKDLDINASQLHLLFEISHENYINQEKIAKRCNINKGSVARSIKKLEEKKLIERKIDCENRRQNIISLTQKGRDILSKSSYLLNIWEEEVFDDKIIEKELLQESLKDILIKTIMLNKKGEENE